MATAFVNNRSAQEADVFGVDFSSRRSGNRRARLLRALKVADRKGRQCRPIPEPACPRMGLDGRTWALAYQAIIDTRCPKCGNPLDVCTDEDTQDRWQPMVTTCYATQAQDDFIQ